MANFSIKNLLNFFTGNNGMRMVRDVPPSAQPEGTYRNAWGVSGSTTDEVGDGLYSANAMDLCASHPEGFIQRGKHLIEEKNRLILFLYNPTTEMSEIGYIDKEKCEYVKILDDDDIEGCNLDFGTDEWIDIVDKSMKDGTCYNTHIYWTNKTYYKRLNIDDPCLPLKCEDIYLLKCHAAPAPKTLVSETGGRDLESGVYQYIGQFIDEDSNETNWFKVSNPVSISSDNNIPGEPSENAIHVSFNNLSPEYSKINIAVIKTIGSATSVHLLDTIYYNTSGVSFVHRSVSQEKYEIDPQEILARKNGFFRGYDIFQFNGELYPYNLIGEENEQWQEMLENVEIGYRIIGVPIEFAHQYRGLRGDEVYAIGIQGNYCDGTHTRTFHKKGRLATPYEREIIQPSDENCLDCEKERWEVENTAERTEELCTPASMVDIRGNVSYGNDLPGFIEDEIEEDVSIKVDETGTPSLDDGHELSGREKRILECQCKKLAATHTAFSMLVESGVLFAPGSNILLSNAASILSDPVAVARSYCACLDLAREGEDDESSTGSGDSGNP